MKQVQPVSHVYSEHDQNKQGSQLECHKYAVRLEYDGTCRLNETP